MFRDNLSLLLINLINNVLAEQSLGNQVELKDEAIKDIQALIKKYQPDPGKWEKDHPYMAKAQVWKNGYGTALEDSNKSYGLEEK